MRAPLPAIGAILFACATAPVRVPFEVSAPAVIPDGVLGRIDADGSTTLYMDGWDLNIAVQNQRSYVRGSGWDLGVVLFPLPMIIPTIAPEVNPLWPPRKPDFTFTCRASHVRRARTSDRPALREVHGMHRPLTAFRCAP